MADLKTIIFNLGRQNISNQIENMESENLFSYYETTNKTSEKIN